MVFGLHLWKTGETLPTVPIEPVPQTFRAMNTALDSNPPRGWSPARYDQASQASLPTCQQSTLWGRLPTGRPCSGSPRGRRNAVAALGGALFLVLLLGLVPRAVCAGQHEVWLLSTRGMPDCPCADEASAIRYWRLMDDCQWVPADAGEFHAGDDPATPTVVYIHGNRTDADEAVSNGCYVDQAIQCQAAERPFRFVIWSWPADRACRRNRPDVQLKADRSDADAYYLARWLQELRPGVKVSLVGHSFGPRIIAGAMQLLAGGELAGQCLSADIVASWTRRSAGNT